MIILNGGVRVFTTEGGFFHVLLAPGNHNIEAVADGYQQQRQEVQVHVFYCAGWDTRTEGQLTYLCFYFFRLLHRVFDHLT